MEAEVEAEPPVGTRDLRLVAGGDAQVATLDIQLASQTAMSKYFTFVKHVNSWANDISKS